MSIDPITEICQEHITYTAHEYSRLFEKVKPHASSEFHAWMVTQELMQQVPARWSRLEPDDDKNGPVNKGQLDFLHGLGIRELKDLNWRQATVLIDLVLAQCRQQEPY